MKKSLSPFVGRCVAIVGRPNVGKSALFNRLAGRQIAIVHDEPGITRDRIAADVRPHKSSGVVKGFELIDTGGIGGNVDKDFSAQVRAEAEMAIASANVILFVVDGRSGVTPVDQDLAQFLRRTASKENLKKVLLVVNKIDEPKRHSDLAADFYQLGFEETFLVSAAHGGGTKELIRAIESRLPKEEAVEPSEEELDATDSSSISIERGTIPKLAIVGRPNVGKSSLTNALLGADRTLVSDIAGTTRDAIDVPCKLRGKSYTLIDTAGLRHRRKHNTSVEVFSSMRSEKSIRRADLCVLVIDGSQGVTSQDRQIAGLIQEAHKPCVIVINKWDLVLEKFAEETGIGVLDSERAIASHPEAKKFMREWTEKARAELFFIDYAPMIALSAKAKKNLNRLSSAIEDVRKAAKQRVGTGPLNRVLQAAFTQQPPPIRSGRRFKLLYATQVDANADRPAAISVPTFLCFVNDESILPDTYRHYLENQLRAHVNPYPGLPILFRFKGREKDTK